MLKLLRLKRLRSGPRRDGGFLLSEVVVAAGILAFFISGSLVANTQMNKLAVVSRKRTLAMAAAQQQIDRLMTVSWGVATPRPAMLAVGTTTVNNIPIDNDSFNSQSGLSSNFTTLDLQVNGTRTTTITDVTIRTLRAVVTGTYVLHGRNYS